MLHCQLQQYWPLGQVRHPQRTGASSAAAVVDASATAVASCRAGWVEASGTTIPAARGSGLGCASSSPSNSPASALSASLNTVWLERARAIPSGGGAADDRTSSGVEPAKAARSDASFAGSKDASVPGCTAAGGG